MNPNAEKRFDSVLIEVIITPQCELKYSSHQILERVDQNKAIPGLMMPLSNWTKLM